MGKWGSCFDRILFILAGNDNIIYKSLDELSDPGPQSYLPIERQKIDVATISRLFFTDPFHTYM